MLPPASATRRRTSQRPRPVPLDLVLKKAANTSPSGRPGPLSATRKCTLSASLLRRTSTGPLPPETSKAFHQVADHRAQVVLAERDSQVAGGALERDRGPLEAAPLVGDDRAHERLQLRER